MKSAPKVASRSMREAKTDIAPCGARARLEAGGAKQCGRDGVLEGKGRDGSRGVAGTELEDSQKQPMGRP